MGYRLFLMRVVVLLICYGEKDRVRDILLNNGNGFIYIFKYIF